MALALLLAAQLAAAALPQDCQAALGSLYDGTEETALSGQVDGATLRDARALVALRRARGDALITVKGGDFSGADFQGARLHNICFFDTNLSRSDWRGAEAPGTGFIRAVLANADLRGAHLRRVLLRLPDMKEVDASGADFSGGRLDGGWDGSMENLKLDGADLSGFRFDCGITLGDGCPLDGQVSIARANLTGASIGSYNRFTDWTGARIDRTEVELQQLPALAAAEIAGPILVRGGEAVVELSPAEHRAMLPHMSLTEQAASPSFDCAAASTPVERLICGEAGATLRALDRDVADLYRRAGPAVAASQQAWLRERDRCPLTEDMPDLWCVQQSYERRREALIARIGPPAWLRPGATALFVAPPMQFDEAFRAEPLYQRLLPVIIGASWSNVAVRANRDGTIDARGDALGANAHMCSLAGDGLRFDPDTGWYSGPYRPTGEEPAQWRTRPMPVLLVWGDRAAVYLNGRSNYGTDEGDPRLSDYASCGARAGFSEMLLMPVPEDEAARRFEAMGEAD